MSLENGRKTMDIQDWTESNTNTLETMSAKSFGSFVRPSPKVREDEIVKRIQRHRSFFDGEHNHHPPSKNVSRIDEPQIPNHFSKQYYHPSNGNVIRRAESFQHNSKSLIDFEHNLPNSKLQRQARNGKTNKFESSMDLFEKRYGNEVNNKPNLHKAKSMEFLKSKLLPRKQPPPNPSPSPSSASSHFSKSGAGYKKSGLRSGISHASALSPLGKCNIGSKANSNGNIGHIVQPPTSRQRSHSPWSHSRENIHSKDPSRQQLKSSKQHLNKNGNNDYDWRQDTPFWNGKKPVPEKKGKKESSSQPFSMSQEEIIGPWQHLPHLHQRSASINPIISPTQPQPNMMHQHATAGWHNHAVFSGNKNGLSSQHPIQNQGLFLGAMRRFSPTPYVPASGVQKNNKPVQLGPTSPSPQGVHSVHLHQPSHFAGIHPVSIGNVVNVHPFFRPTHSSGVAAIPSGIQHFPHQVPMAYNTNLISMGPSSNSASLGVENGAIPSEKLSDRLEITELSDHEGDLDALHQPVHYSKSSASNGHRNAENNKGTSNHKQIPAHLRRQQVKTGGGAQNKKGVNIFDMPSGMY